jgi:hypothetical protein
MNHTAINADDAFRHAFTLIARHAIPYMASDSYLSDLLYDAARASELATGERFYLLVRALGTNVFAYGDDAVRHCDPRLSDGRAVLKVVRTRFGFDVTPFYVLPTLVEDMQ